MFFDFFLLVLEEFFIVCGYFVDFFYLVFGVYFIRLCFS